MQEKNLYYTDKGYSYLKCNVNDCFRWGGYGICDSCGQNMKNDIYLIYILGQAFCSKCFKEWVEDSTKYNEDLELQKRNHIQWYNAYGFEILNNFEEGEFVAYIGRNPQKEIYTVEIGKIKKLCNDGAFVYYNTENTSAKTSYCDLYKIKNNYALITLGVELGGTFDA